MFGFRRMVPPVFWVGFVYVFLLALPFVLGQGWATEQLQYMGNLLNPTDAHAYLSKMVQGQDGAWRARFLHSAFPGDGSLIYVYYLFLGHLSKWLSLPLVLVYNLARIIAGAGLGLAMYRFYRAAIGEQVYFPWLFAWGLFGTGLGWLGLLFGAFTIDFWVMEAYPFLTGLVNPHFPLALALMLYLLSRDMAPATQRSWGQELGQGAFSMLLAMLLGNLSPFGGALTVAVLGLSWAWMAWAAWLPGVRFSALLKQRLKSTQFSRLMGVLVGVGISSGYALFIVRTQPAFAAWNAQNITPAPPVWDVFLAFSPALWLAPFGVLAWWRERQRRSPVLVFWAVLAFAALFTPFDLQRRFLVGLYVPLVGLAFSGVHFLTQRRQAQRLWFAGLIFLALPTSLIVFGSGLMALSRHDSNLYLQQDVAASFNWLRTNAIPDTLVLTDAQTGLVLPTYTGLRVVYGHPFESVPAGEAKAWVEAYFTGAADLTQLADVLPGVQVDYVLVNWSVLSVGLHLDLQELELIYQNSTVQIYRKLP